MIEFSVWLISTGFGVPYSVSNKFAGSRYAPLTFIPFYAVPWVICGLALVLLGNLAGFPMMFGWLAFLPYLLIAGYVVSGLTVALYRTVFS
ncbi:hypothetical protein [Pseudomonas sp. LB3P14]